MKGPKISLTTKAVATLLQLQKSGQLITHPHFQRGRVWTKKEKSGFIDSVLNDRPIRAIYAILTSRMKKGRSEIAVIDGQRGMGTLREFLDGDFGLTELDGGSVAKGYKGKRYSDLPSEMQRKLRGFKFIVMELSGYSESKLRDVIAMTPNQAKRLSKNMLRRVRQHQNPRK